MSDPKHFKQLLPKAPKKVLPLKPGLVLTEEYIRSQEAKKKAMIAFVKTLRCPLCQAQLDGGVFPDRASLHCQADLDHYTAEYNTAHILKSQVFRLTFGDCGYTIQASMLDGEEANISVSIIERAYNHVMQQHKIVSQLCHSRNELFHYTGCLPEITSTTTEQDLVHELKLMALFS